MKRVMALALAMLLCAGVALAAEWPEGTSSSQPYPGRPQVDLNEEFGYLMFYPDQDVEKGLQLFMSQACQHLYIYLPREDVKLGDGTFYLCSERPGVIWQTKMNNTDAITLRPMDEEELEGLLWGGGVCVEIKLPKTLELGRDYFVNMTRGCLIAGNGIDSPEVGGTDAWSFRVEGDYGVNLMEYRRPLGNGKYEEGILHPQAGDEIRFDLVLGGDAVMAVVNRYRDNTVEFETQLYETSGEVTGIVLSDDPVWYVMFMDAQGAELNRVEFW